MKDIIPILALLLYLHFILSQAISGHIEDMSTTHINTILYRSHGLFYRADSGSVCED